MSAVALRENLLFFHGLLVKSNITYFPTAQATFILMSLRDQAF